MTDERRDEADPFEGDQFTDGASAGDIDIAERPYGIYQCRDCENVVLTMRDCEGGMTCHGEPMEPVTDTRMDIEPPDIRQVLLDAFGLPKPGLDICLCVIGDGPLPPEEVADRLDYDPSTVRRYLNELVEMGLLTKSQLNREGGGFVNVYHSIDIGEMRRESLIGFYVWAGEAATLIERANLTKEDYVSEGTDEPLTDVFWEDFEQRRGPDGS